MIVKEKSPTLSANNAGGQNGFKTSEGQSQAPTNNHTPILQNCDAKINVCKENNVKKFQREIQPTLEKAYAGGEVAFQKAIDDIRHKNILNEDFFNAIDEVVESIIESKKKEIDRLEASEGEFFRCEMDGITYRLPPYYKMDNGGVFRYDEKNGYKPIFTRPVLVSGISQDVETKAVAYQLSFVNIFEAWQSKLVSARAVSDRNEIIKLCADGLPVTSENAKALVSYLNGFIASNPATLPRMKSASRLGWYDGAFIPYDDDVKLCGDDALYQGVTEAKGSRDEWRRVMIPERHKSPIFRAMMAASAGSVLLSIVGGLPFVVHVFGPSGCGKSVALNAAMSIWGDTETIVKSLNATNNALLHHAATMKHFPVALDELETRQANENTDQLLYQITEGQSRGRCTKDGTARQVETWKNITLTTGEHEITADSRRGGALNRAFEIPATGKIFDDFASVIECAKSNYGHIGRDFIAGLQSIMENGADGMGGNEFLHFYFDEFRQHAQKSVEGKQAGAAAVLLLGDMLFSMIVEGESVPDAVASAAKFEPILLSWGKCDVSGDIAQRAYQLISDFVTENETYFQDGGKSIRGNCYGRIDGEETFSILPKTLIAILKKEQFQVADSVSKMRKAGLLIPGSDGKNQTSQKLNGRTQKLYRFKFV